MEEKREITVISVREEYKEDLKVFLEGITFPIKASTFIENGDTFIKLGNGIKLNAWCFKYKK